MGLIDRFNERVRDIGKFGATVRKSLEPTTPVLTLGEDRSSWAQSAVSHLKLDWEFAEFSDRVAQHVQDAGRALEHLTSEKRIQELPERARTVNQIHGQEYAQKARKVLIATKFDDLYRYDEDHQRFMQAMQEFRDGSNRNATALREHMGTELDAVQTALQKLEDETIRFAQLLETKHFVHVKQLKEAHDALVTLNERQAKEEELAASLRTDKEKAVERIGTLEGHIKEQEDKIRNDDAREALTQLTRIEEQLEKLIAPVQTAARDARKYYKRFSDIAAPKGTMQLLESLERDASRELMENQSNVADTFTAISSQIAEENRANTKPLSAKLERVASEIESTASKVAALVPQQRELRRGIMRDVAALAAYDHRQFLFTAKRDASAIDAKLTFLEAELDPAKRITHERALKDAAINLGAVIEGEPVPTPHDASSNVPQTTAEADEEIEHAEASLKKANEMLGGNAKPKRKKGKR